MKKLFLLSITFFSIILNLYSQDLIVTHKGDSLNCKITKTTKDYVHFTFKYNDEIRKTLLPINQITTQQKDYFTESELLIDHKVKDSFPHFRVAVDGGWQYRTAKMASGMDAGWENHYKKLRSGFHYDIQTAYFFSEMMGVELMVSQQLFGHSLGSAQLTDNNGNIIGTGQLKEKIAFNYFGANYIVRLFNSKETNCWLFAIGYGYLGYRDRLLFGNIETTKLTAGTLGTNLSIGYDIGLSKALALGFKVSVIGGKFKNYKQTVNGQTIKDTLPYDNSEGLGTIRLSTGLCFNK